MNRDLPSPAVRLFRGETRVVMPSLVQEFVGAIRQVAPGEAGIVSIILRSRASDSLDSMSAFPKSFRLGYRLATSVTSLSPDVPAQTSGKASALAPM